MGGASSRDNTGKGSKADERTYLLPDDRAKDRFTPLEQQHVSSLFDPSVDKVNFIMLKMDD